MMKKLGFVAIGCAFVLAACATDPFTGERTVSNAGIGAATGAALGALTGAVIGNNVGDGDARRGTLIGAGIGALTGGGIGAYMDQQEAKLRAQLAATGVSVTRNGDQIILNMPSNITFDTGQASLKPEFFGVLNSVALVFQEFPRTLIDIYGHTDSDGSEQFNLDLSQRRAEAVASYLSAQRIDPRRMLIRGFGETQPIAPNTTEAGKAQNRRVEIRIAPLV